MAQTKSSTKDLNELLSNMQSIDPMGAIVVASAGLAGLCGVKGPLTTVMEGIGGIGGVGGKVQPGSPLDTTEQVLNVLEWWNFFLQPNNGSPALPADNRQRQALLTAIGTASSNMVEAAIMYTLVKNPDTMQTVFGIAQQAATGAIGLGKAGAAIIGG